MDIRGLELEKCQMWVPWIVLAIDSDNHGYDNTDTIVCIMKTVCKKMLNQYCWSSTILSITAIDLLTLLKA